MKKQKIQMIGLLVVLLLLAAAFLGLKQYNKVQSEKAAKEDTTETLIDLDTADLVSFSYIYEGESYSFEKQDDTWYYVEDHSLKLNQNKIQAMIKKIAPLKVQQKIENVTDMSQYGLDVPERTIQYETEKESIILKVGNRNSMTGEYYICLPSETTVYTVEANVINGFQYTLDDLIEQEEESTEAETSAQ